MGRAAEVRRGLVTAPGRRRRRWWCGALLEAGQTAEDADQGGQEGAVEAFSVAVYTGKKTRKIKFYGRQCFTIKDEKKIFVLFYIFLKNLFH